MPTPVYRNFSQAELDARYDNRAAVPHHQAIQAGRTERSVALYARVQCDRDVPYGNGARQRLDFFHCGKPKRPTLAYIHGGYWQWNDKEPSAFIAEGLLARDVNVALVEYTLAPAATMDAIVTEIQSCTRWLLARLTTQFRAAGKLIVSGHSAGGHLTAIALEVPGVHAGIAISGLFDLEPIRLSYLNAAIHLSPEDARRNSPVHRTPGTAPCVVTVGGAELSELVRQSTEYAAFLRGNQRDVRELVLPGDDHFSILDHMALPDGVLANAAVELFG
ncbi:MAG: alpha/beta hydrolase [Burkholderiales bacterium]